MSTHNDAMEKVREALGCVLEHNKKQLPELLLPELLRFKVEEALILLSAPVDAAQPSVPVAEIEALADYWRSLGDYIYRFDPEKELRALAAKYKVTP